MFTKVFGFSIIHISVNTDRAEKVYKAQVF